MENVESWKVKALSKMVHEANKVFCEANGDFSQEHWSEAPDYNHTSAMVTVQALLDNPDTSPEDLHDIWMNTKKADGWVYGETKDREKKTHPSIVPYDDLNVVEKYKDHLVRDIVLSYVNFRKTGK